MRLALVLLATFLVAAPAQAASTKVTWPEARAYGAGEQLAVSVKGDRKVKVSVLRVSSSGKVLESLVRRTLRRGKVKATLPRAGTYEVRVGARARTLRVAAAAPDCPLATPQSLEVRLAADRVQRGQAFRFSVVNVGDTCATTGVDYALEHQRADGSWEPASWVARFPPAALQLQPGEEIAQSRTVPADAPLGSYRVIETGGFTEPTFEVVA